ncbi:MAG TPA: efflux RND transporter permease subunit [Candidatus Dormibacteraeota bacterium]|nr:efflux RND transporter permease subunit [Candidatus Dormibacteraeota bacterium]
MMNQQNTLSRLLLQPVFWVLVYGALVGYGAYALWKIPVEVLPQFNFPEISVITHEPGATAEELETQITWPVEGEILALPNIVNLRSTMGNGTVETDVRFQQGTDPQAELQSVNGAIDRARGRIPTSVHPLAEIMGNAINEVADYTAQIPVTVPPVEVQRDVLANIVPALRALPGVQRVEVYGAGDEGLWVQPDLSAMVRYRVPITSITQALQQDVLLQPGGYLSQSHQDTFIEVRNLPVTTSELADIPVSSITGRIPLGNLARIVRGPVPTLNTIYFDSKHSIALIVFKQPGASTVPVTQAVQSTLTETSGQLPHGVHWVRIYDQGHLVHVVGADLTRNLLIGGTLAIAVMLWVLGASGGVWILAISIPLSLLMAIAGLYSAGQSLNLMTLGALTVAVGLLADDGIIVLESIYHRWEQGDEHRVGIANGLREIASPDVTGTLTTGAVFIPLLFVGGLAGLFFIPFALAMALALLASLVISLSLVPLSLGLLRTRARETPTSATRALDKLSSGNMRLFHFVARHPRASLISCVVILVASIGGLVLVPVNFLPLPNEGVLLESFALAPGSSMLDTERTVTDITRRLRSDPAVGHTFARIGSSTSTMYTEPAYAGEIQVTLKPNVSVNSLTEIADRLHAKSQFPGVQLAFDTPTIERVGESLSGLPQPFVLNLYGSSVTELRTLADEITARLRTVPALSGVFNNDAYPVTELQLEPKPGALAASGLTPFELNDQISPLLNGDIVAQVPEGNVPLDIYVRLADAPQKSLDDLSRLPIRTAGWTPLGQLASLKMITTPIQIRHIDGARALQILATPTGPLGSAIASARSALSGLRLPPGYRIAFGGLYPQLEDAALGLAIAAAAAFVLMAGIMILQFEGLLVPGILLLQIPLAFSGGLMALIASGVGLNAVGLVGLLTLVGIGLNHGIVLLYRARRNEASGMAPEEAVTEAVHVRFRPITLTTLTAVLGMLPTALGWGQGAAPEQGLAVVVMGGIFWSALLSANLIPALYLDQRRKQIAKANLA